jgi:DNA-binding transcriptional LysR family regulator
MKNSECFHLGERTMDFAALKVFKAVVDEGGISSAARKLHRVQSNVTTRIQQLEASLGTALFVRDRRRLYLTPAGELFLGFAEQMLDLSEQARSALQDGAPRGVLRIGTLDSTAASRLPPLLSRYHEQYPTVRLELATGTTDALLEAVKNRKLDAAFVAECESAAPLAKMPLCREELVLLTPRSHAPVRRPHDVHTDTIISFPTGCEYRRRLQAWLGSGGVVPERVLELSSYHAIVACVAAGTGVAVAPRSVLDTFRGPIEVAVFSLGSRNAVTTYLVWRDGECPLALKALRSAMQSLGKDGLSRARTTE